MSKSNRVCLIFILVMTLFAQCNSKKTKVEGFIIFSNPDYWYFVPVKHFNYESCVENLRSDNLLRGTQFRPFFNGKVQIQNALDTLQLENVPHDFHPSLKSLKVTPVLMEYEVDLAKVEKSSIFKFHCLTSEREIDFSFNVLPIQIREVVPISCDSIQ
jgi:hypothetical protein